VARTLLEKWTALRQYVDFMSAKSDKIERAGDTPQFRAAANRHAQMSSNRTETGDYRRNGMHATEGKTFSRNRYGDIQRKFTHRADLMEAGRRAGI
jgi:hypothetical protein